MCTPTGVEQAKKRSAHESSTTTPECGRQVGQNCIILFIQHQENHCNILKAATNSESIAFIRAILFLYQAPTTMDSDLSDDGQSRTSRNTRRTRTAWVPNDRSNGASTLGQPPTFNSNVTSIIHNPNSQSIGLLDPILSEERRRKLDAINKLNSLGAQRDIDLPQIAVIGSQSTGKSSLIESISGITLPRASGTCTRCPTECRLVSSTDPWQCTVSLRFLRDDFGKPLDRARNVQFGAPIKERRQVEDRLRRAQQAILNPGIDPRVFLEGNQAPQGQNNALAFSANCISLEISGPEITDLSFVDLPGLISSVADGGRDEDVEEVKELVSSYIERPSCIILLTVACEYDFENQGAYRLAQQYDKQGTRTLGILTKPDRIPEGEETRWIRLFKNEASMLYNGWYCVKQPSSKEMETGLTVQEARRRGEEFFSRPPWSRLDPSHRQRLGTRAVTIKLNEFLMAVISKRIPEIMRELQKLLQTTKEELSKLPKPSSQDPVMEIMHLIGNFSDDLHRVAEGFSRDTSKNLEGDGSMAERNHFRPIYEAHAKFRREIRKSAPNFRPFDFREDFQAADRNNDEYEPEFLMSEEGEKLCSSQEATYRDDVVQRIEDATTRELPGYFPFQIAQDIISCSTEQWTDPSLFLVHEINGIVIKHQNKLIEKYFARHVEGGLSHTVSHIMHEYMQERLEKAVERVRWLLELEENAFTINQGYYNDYRAKFLNFYKNKLVLYEYEDGRQSTRPWDLNQSALEIMATARAYFHVAYKRVVDNIPLAIDNELVRVNKRSVQEAMSSGLNIAGADGRERCQRLLAEPATIVARREELENRLQRLMAAQRELMGI